MPNANGRRKGRARRASGNGLPQEFFNKLLS